MTAILEALSRVTGAEFPMHVREHVPAVGSLQRAAFLPEVRAVNENKRQITFVASNESVDRYGDIIRVKGWDLANYKKNPVFLWGHRSQDPPIGRTVAISIENNPPALVQTVEFASADTYSFADTIFKLYQGGFLRAVSVGFRPTVAPTPLQDETGMLTGYEFKGQELLELSAVPLPANAQAVARMISDGTISARDAERVFKSAEPIAEPTVESKIDALQNVILQASFQRFSLAVTRHRATVLLSHLLPKRDSGDVEITTIEGLLSPEPAIESLSALERLLRGA